MESASCERKWTGHARSRGRGELGFARELGNSMSMLDACIFCCLRFSVFSLSYHKLRLFAVVKDLYISSGVLNASTHTGDGQGVSAR